MKKDAYAKLLELSKNTALLTSIQALLDWDQETYMPKDAIHARSLQIELLSGLLHKAKTNPQFTKALNALIDVETGEIQDDRLTPLQIAALREFRRDYLHDSKLTSAFIKNFSKTTSTAIHAWKSAKDHNDFREFAPHLEKIVSLSRKKADLLGFKDHPYDALLDLYEPEMKTSYLIPLFTQLKLKLTYLVQQIAACPQPATDFLNGEFPKYKQMNFSHQLLRAMGFHGDTSRLDLTHHPFCTSLHPTDVRMTTRIHPDNPMFNIFCILHEGGHGLYEMNLNKDFYGTPLCSAISLGIHESQSRFWETLIGHSLPFWEHFFPRLQEEFPEQFNAIALPDFYQAIHTVKPGLIRIQSDEVTYNLHIIVRFEIEKALIEGSLKVRDVPGAWNEKMREYLGISPSFDGEGCLQDIHWAMGGLGYFPTYTLGNLFAAQFFAAFEKAHPDWKAKISQGQVDFIREWLKENIHQHGRQYTSSELCQKVTGKPLSAEPFINYLEGKYKTIYHI
jgi:carboxypeptidase Taq